MKAEYVPAVRSCLMHCPSGKYVSQRCSACPAFQTHDTNDSAQALAAGKTIDQAYREAGYAAHRGNASTLRSKQHIRARVAELQSRAADGAVLNRQWVMDGLVENVERSHATQGGYA